MRRLRTSALVVGMLIVGPASPSGAADKKEEKAPDFVAKALAREIIGLRQTLADVVEYCDARVPRMPEVKSLAEWEKHADRMRSEALEKVIYRGEAAAWRDAKSRVEWLETIEGGPGYRIKKLRYEALPGLWIPALLYEPEKLEGKVPVVLNVNGHDGKGKAAPYKQVRCINLAKRGILALNTEWFGMGQFGGGDYRHDLINHIDLCGSGGIATHFLAMKRGIDVLLALEHADPARVAVTGLSGGGWQTIFISAFDTRVALTDPVAGYSSFRTRARYFSDLGDSEQTPSDLASVTDYAHMTAMMAPRATLLTFNAKDNCCFASPHALGPLLDAAVPIYSLYGKEGHLRAHVNADPGTHNYERDNREAFYRMVGDVFFKGDGAYARDEISSDAEVKTSEALNVALPGDNVSLHSLALALSKPLPRQADLPRDKDAARSWRDANRAKLREVIRAKRYEVRAEKVAAQEHDGTQATFWRLRLGEWSVPVVELSRGTPKSSALVVADDGRKANAKEIEERLAKGDRVFAVDPYYVGESKVAERDYLFSLFLATVGDRPLGIQASQLAAVARWARADRASGPITLVASGSRTSAMALVAAGLDDDTIGEVVVKGTLGSFKELIESKAAYTQAPELFGFGLLRDFDVAQLAALAAPRKVRILKPSDRAKKELAGLAGWYGTWGIDCNPFE